MYYRSTFATGRSFSLDSTDEFRFKPHATTGFWYVLLLFAMMLWLPNAGYAQSRGIALEPLENIAKTPYLPGQFRALIIGNNKYNDTTGRWLPLITAATDAASVEKLLRDKYGFSDITRLTNATRRETLIALSDLSQRVLPNDSVLVFYAGHGYIDAATNKGFWVPTDAEGTDHTTFLRNSTIRDEISIIADRSKHTLLIADSCFSGTLLRRGTSLPAPEAITEKYYNKVAKKKSVQIMTSGGIEFVDDNYRKSGHSPFTHFLLNELENNDSPMVTVSELSANVTKAVANNVDQTPNSGVLAGSGDELGEFIFVRVKLKVNIEGVPADKVKVQVELVQEADSNTASTEQSPGLIATTATPAVKNNATQTSISSEPTSSKLTTSKPMFEDIIFPIPSL